MTGSIWDQVLSRVETKVNRHIFYTWFKPTTFIRDEGSTLRIRVPTALFRDWLTKHYAAVLDEALGEINRRGTAITFVSESAEVTEPAVIPSAAPLPTPEMFSDAVGDGNDAPAGSLAPRYSFDTFIVGPSNQFAHAACRAVAETPSRSYNPLFIYGGVGGFEADLTTAAIDVGQRLIQDTGIVPRQPVAKE